jgi:hypothetical protein
MLIEKDYTRLWKKHFSQFNKLEMPSYQEYQKREAFFKEYLTHIPSSGIEYILVAEAAPFHDKSKTEVGAYFYNYSNVAGLATPYFKAPCKAYDVKYKRPLTKEKAQLALQELAKKGVILLDLFPFAISYTSPLRRQLINSGVLEHFWDGDDYSIKTQIQRLCKNLDGKWDLCLIAPPIISNHIVENFHAIYIKPCNNGNHNQTTFEAILRNDLRGCDHKKVAVDTSGNPNATLIKIAFDL